MVVPTKCLGHCVAVQTKRRGSVVAVRTKQRGSVWRYRHSVGWGCCVAVQTKRRGSVWRYKQSVRGSVWWYRCGPRRGAPVRGGRRTLPGKHGSQPVSNWKPAGRLSGFRYYRIGCFLAHGPAPPAPSPSPSPQPQPKCVFWVPTLWRGIGNRKSSWRSSGSSRWFTGTSLGSKYSGHSSLGGPWGTLWSLVAVFGKDFEGRFRFP